MLEKEYKYYQTNKTDLLKQFQGEFIVIKNNKVIGNYVDKITAINETVNKKHLKMGSFLVQHVLPSQSEPVQRFCSRVYV